MKKYGKKGLVRRNFTKLVGLYHEAKRPKNQYEKVFLMEKFLTWLERIADKAQGPALIFIGAFMIWLAYSVLQTPWPLVVKAAGSIGGLIGTFCLYKEGIPIIRKWVMPTLIRFIELIDEVVRILRYDVAWESLKPRRPLKVSQSWTPKVPDHRVHEDAVIYRNPKSGKEECELVPSTPLPPWYKF